MVSDYDPPSDRWQRHRSNRVLAALHDLYGRFSSGERMVLYVLSVTLAFSALSLLYFANSGVSETVPSSGGTLREGVVGPARFINPLLTLSAPDQDLSALVYSGLMRALPDGRLAPDLAASYQVSQDGTTYTFKLRPTAQFHDGTQVTSQDVLFTIQKAKDPATKSIHRADWDGVNVSAPDTSTVVFQLPHAYAPFLENTTLGILPRHLWQGVSAEEFPFSPLNTHPVGSGPYRLASFDTDENGVATRYTLVPFTKFTLGAPYISKLVFLFYPNEEALIGAYNAGQIDSFAGVSPSQLKSLDRSGTDIVRVALPRVFGIFFNQGKNPALADAGVRAALDAAVDKQTLLRGVLSGFGTTLAGPIPPNVLGDMRPATPAPITVPSVQSATSTAGVEKARAILSQNGWTYDDKNAQWTKKGKGKTAQVLQLSLATADEPELAATAQAVAEEWRALGVKVEVHVYSLSELNTAVIRPRAYDAVLFGEVVGRSLDLFAFWHSSQRNDPGLNLALYANSKVDALLSQARATTNESARDKLYQQFASLVQKDRPAIFLFAPDFLYVVPQDLGGVALGALTMPAERFNNVYQWYRVTERVWSIFAPKAQ